MSDLKKYLMFISYIGSAFRGSQIQILKRPGPSVITVQQVLENAIQNEFKIEGERPVCAHFASRTDKGVHALRAAVVVSLPSFNTCFVKPEYLQFRLNKYLADLNSLRILDVYTVPDSFNVHCAEAEKTYLYRIGLLKDDFKNSNQRFDRPIFEIGRTHFINSLNLFDLERAKETVKLFEGKKDFAAVVGRPSKNIRPTVCNIKSFTVEPAECFVPFDKLAERFNFYHFICKGDRFLYCMVRRLVSLAIGVGCGRINFEDIHKLFNEPVASSWPKCGISVVPGTGLYLVNININMEKFIQKDNHFFENSIVEEQLKCPEKIL